MNAAGIRSLRPAAAGALLLLAVSFTGCGDEESAMVERAERDAIDQIEAIMRAQSEDWSRGDVEAFVSAYSEDCTYLSATAGLSQGREALLERYRTGYPGPEAMGELSFEILEMRPAWVTTRQFFGVVDSEGIGGMSVVARWHLGYPDREPASGLTLIVWRRIEGEWKIVQDASM